MQKLNKTGRILIQYREEYLKHLSDSVDTALKTAVKSFYDDKKIDEKVFRAVFDETISTDDFEMLLSKRNDYTKNGAELAFEFDKIRRNVNEYMISIGFVENMTTKNSVDINKISIIRQFDIDRDFIIAYFGLTPIELGPLMRRRGFIEKFSVLRLNEIMNQIFKELRTPDDIDHAYSLVYYNKQARSFSIDYKYNVNIDLISVDVRMRQVVDKIRQLDKIVEGKFLQKLGGVVLCKSDTLGKQQKDLKSSKTFEPKPSINGPEIVISNIGKSNDAKSFMAITVTKPKQTNSPPLILTTAKPVIQTKPIVQSKPETDTSPLPANIPLKTAIKTEVVVAAPKEVEKAETPVVVTPIAIAPTPAPTPVGSKTLDVLFDISQEDEGLL